MADAASLALLDRRFTEHETRQGNAAPMIVALVETCRGLVEVGELRAASGRLIGLQFGAEDFTADLGVARTEAGEEIRLARQQIAITARAHGLMAIDTPSLEIADGGRLTADARTARSVGMTGKACIHPRQLSVVAEAFRPDDAEIEWAERVMAAEAVASADGRGAFALDGRMVDAPVVARARRILTARR
jgi:citrate lyase subunit beta/citryl-CoA lyase